MGLIVALETLSLRIESKSLLMLTFSTRKMPNRKIPLRLSLSWLLGGSVAYREILVLSRLLGVSVFCPKMYGVMK